MKKNGEGIILPGPSDSWSHDYLTGLVVKETQPWLAPLSEAGREEGNRYPDMPISVLYPLWVEFYLKLEGTGVRLAGHRASKE